MSEETKSKVLGMGVDTPTTINSEGGKQSLLGYDFTLIDPLTLFRLAQVAKYGGEKYGAWNWRRISTEDHINHALAHLLAFLAGDEQDDHLGHAFTRVMFALSTYLTPGESPRMLPDKMNEEK